MTHTAPGFLVLGLGDGKPGAGFYCVFVFLFPGDKCVYVCLLQKRQKIKTNALTGDLGIELRISKV